VWETSGRLLRLLGLLQRQTEWSAENLALECEVTTRTVRRDVARLRDLGYPIATEYGAGGGYRLEAGATLPPLMFDTDEAVATLLALHAAAESPPSGSARDVLSALDKLTLVMPARLKPTIDALIRHTSRIDLGQLIGTTPVETDTAALVLLARACRERHQVTYTYRTEAGSESSRRVEPLGLVNTLGRWYLVAYCLDGHDWGVFYVDRMSDLATTRTPTGARKPPADDLDAYVTARLGQGYQQVSTVVRIHAPLRQAESLIKPAWGSLTAETPDTCIMTGGAEDHDTVARWLLLIDADIDVIQPPELAQAFGRLASRCARAAASVNEGEQPLPSTREKGEPVLETPSLHPA
jgi:predicted DNA-binding transcriptional regulator YafY